MKLTIRLFTVFALAFLIFLACKKNSKDDTDKMRSLPNKLASATQIDTVNATAILPLYRGQDDKGGDVYYIITESNNVDKSIELGLNWTPKLVHAIGTMATQTATVVSGGAKNPNDFPILKFAGNVDFAPVEKLVPGPHEFSFRSCYRTRFSR